MTTEPENKLCPKCLSANLPSATYCRYCHEKFNQAKTFTGGKGKRRINRKLLIVGSALAIAARYIFRRKSFGRKKRQLG